MLNIPPFLIAAILGLPVVALIVYLTKRFYLPDDVLSFRDSCRKDPHGLLFKHIAPFSVISAKNSTLLVDGGSGHYLYYEGKARMLSVQERRLVNRWVGEAYATVTAPLGKDGAISVDQHVGAANTPRSDNDVRDALLRAFAAIAAQDDDTPVMGTRGDA